MYFRRIILGIVFGLAIGAAHTEPVTFNFTGRVGSASSGIFEFPEDTLVTGSYTFDTALTDSFPGDDSKDEFVDSGNQAFVNTVDITVTVGNITRSTSASPADDPSFLIRWIDSDSLDQFAFNVFYSA
jgi:hypothetical protein